MYVLKRFSQDVDLENPTVSHNYLVFLRPDGTELRVPVPAETVMMLTKEIFDPNKSKEAFAAQVEEELNEEPEDPPDEDELEEYDLDVKYGSGSLGDEPEEPEEVVAPTPALQKLVRRNNVPRSEEEVPSL